MRTIAEYGIVLHSVPDVRDTLGEYILPWQSGIQNAMDVYKLPDHCFYGEAADIYGYISQNTQILGCSSCGSPLVNRNAADHNNALYMGDATDDVNESVPSGTREIDVNKINQDDLEFFRTLSRDIVNAIINTDFEDGKDNDVTELIKSFKGRNKIATYCWLNELYVKNLEDHSFIEGLLRVLAIVADKGDEPALMSIVVAGLRSGNSAEQEAAIMVIEEWRTKECLDVLNTSLLPSGWIRRYANKVKGELEKELDL